MLLLMLLVVLLCRPRPSRANEGDKSFSFKPYCARPPSGHFLRLW